MDKKSFLRAAAEADAADDVYGSLAAGLKYHTDKMLDLVREAPIDDFPIVVAAMEFTLDKLRNSKRYRKLHAEDLVRMMRERFTLQETYISFRFGGTEEK